MNFMQIRIEFLLKKHGTLRQVAEKTGISHGYLCKLHRGENHFPSDDVLEKLGLKRTITYALIK